MTLGEWLRQERRALDLSQGDLARESGVSKSMISLLETDQGVVQNTTLRRLRQMVATLGISLIEAYLYAGLLDTEDERDQDAITVALLVRELSPQRRAELIDQLRQEER